MHGYLMEMYSIISICTDTMSHLLPENCLKLSLSFSYHDSSSSGLLSRPPCLNRPERPNHCFGPAQTLREHTSHNCKHTHAHTQILHIQMYTLIRMRTHRRTQAYTNTCTSSVSFLKRKPCMFSISGLLSAVACGLQEQFPLKP